jgi:hypothetical protein
LYWLPTSLLSGNFRRAHIRCTVWSESVWCTPTYFTALLEFCPRLTSVSKVHCIQMKHLFVRERNSALIKHLPKSRMKSWLQHSTSSSSWPLRFCLLPVHGLTSSNNVSHVSKIIWLSSYILHGNQSTISWSDFIKILQIGIEN